MELIKKNIHMNRQVMDANGQITVDNDFNVPDNKADIEKIVMDKGKIKIEEIKSAQDHVTIRGQLVFQILYLEDTADRRVHSIEGKIPFEEVLNMDGLTPTDNVNVKYELEDLSIGIVNSRKISIKALISFYASVDELYDEEVVMDVDQDGMQMKKTVFPVLQMTMHKKDTCRVKDEIMLPSNKANIFELLWSSVQPRNVDIKQMENQLSVHGELYVFLIYTSEEDGHPVQTMEEVVPFHNTVECLGSSTDMISFVTWEMPQSDVEIKADYDGEERSFGIECMFDMDIKFYQEEEMQVLSDVYSIKEEVNPVMNELSYPKLLMKNQSVIRLNDKIRINKGQGTIMQIVHADGTIKVEDVEKTEDGFNIQGIMELQILYVTEDENVPFETIKGVIPFDQNVEIPEMNDSSDCQWQAGLEQLSANAADGEEIEIKATLNFNVLAQEQKGMQIVKEIETSPLDFEKLQEMPGIVGYISDGKKSLWDIAKEYATTMENLQKTNDLTSDRLKRGDKLIIVKSV